ncbi:beta-ketoacyl-[acyl-carrier-protein] synthase family protein [Staphylococcus warneri]|uniref:beta-ketoacyl-[acyl-carrier-protein] synthase family protein n=1 Tax=Staphylococcus warneri TaxID=1292 RepID=UPI00214CCB4E|nr:beta-ketoacyl-[acyl-carrier-protein] synthase family protein [Staphylococcus warneri]MCR1798089.1 beta-ketoacyl-[acyl-carrier-protein] synthase family protein [Staphylococcus warneri]
MRRVVITGIGLTSPAGKTVHEFWENLNKGKNFVVESDSMIKMGLKSSSHALIRDKSHLFKYGKNLDNFIKFGLYAGETAWKDSGLNICSIEDRSRVGLISASAIGGTQTVANKFKELLIDDNIIFNNDDSHFYDSGMYHTLNVLLKRKLGMKGITTALSTGCTAGMDCLGLGFEEIIDGDLDVCLIGASEAPLVDFTYATLDVIGCLSKNNFNYASCPFSLDRNGFVISEGSAFLVLEEYNHAKNRNAKIYAEVEDFHSINNGKHMTNLKPDGLDMYELLNSLFEKRKETTIDYINAHGSSTKQNDLFETEAYKKFFGKEIYKIPISSTKSMIGHSLSSASLFGCISAIMSISTSKIHPTINLNNADEKCDLNYVPNYSINKKVDNALVTASGFGGIHSAVILKKIKEGGS